MINESGLPSPLKSVVRLQTPQNLLLSIPDRILSPIKQWIQNSH